MYSEYTWPVSFIYLSYVKKEVKKSIFLRGYVTFDCPRVNKSGFVQVHKITK